MNLSVNSQLTPGRGCGMAWCYLTVGHMIGSQPFCEATPPGERHRGLNEILALRRQISPPHWYSWSPVDWTSDVRRHTCAMIIVNLTVKLGLTSRGGTVCVAHGSTLPVIPAAGRKGGLGLSSSVFAGARPVTKVEFTHATSEPLKDIYQYIAPTCLSHKRYYTVPNFSQHKKKSGWCIHLSSLCWPAKIMKYFILSPAGKGPIIPVISMFHSVSSLLCELGYVYCPEFHWVYDFRKLIYLSRFSVLQAVTTWPVVSHAQPQDWKAYSKYSQKFPFCEFARCIFYVVNRNDGWLASESI